MILWQGPSQIDGKPIVLIGIKPKKGKANKKTGGMIQTYILRGDIAPLSALKTGDDVSICGDCKHRPANLGTCYVAVFQGPTMVWNKYQKNGYSTLSLKQGAEWLRDGLVRLGAYGDPAAVPFEVWHSLLRYTATWTGYTHQWHLEQFQEFSEYCMASCDTLEELKQAQDKGWRTFTITQKDLATVDPMVKSKAFLCPASEEAGKKIQCESCLACSGTGGSNTASVYIPVHGLEFKQKKFNNLITIGG